MTELPNVLPVLAAVVVTPADVLVIAVPATTTPEQVDEARAHLAEHWPQLVDRVLFLAGATDLAVMRGGAK